MSHALRWIAELCTAGAVIGCAYTLAAGIMLLARRSARNAVPPPASFIPVTILKPLCGAEPGLFDRLAAFCSQDYAGPVQVVFGVRVTGVNTVNRPGKRRRTRFGWGKRPDTKRAIVSLAEGDRIDIFGGPVS